MSHHEPDPSFLAHLEWQMERESRRSQRFANDRDGLRPDGGTGARRRRRVASLMAVVLLSAGSGAGAVIAAESLQEANVRELHQRQAEVRLATSQKRAQFLEGHVAQLRAMMEAGVLPVHELVDAEDELREHERDIALRELDLAEVRRSGKAADDSLSAPLLDDRDFVGERLALRIAGAASAHEQRLAAQSRALALYENGIIPSEEYSRVRTAVEGADAERRGLEERLALRERFVSGELDAERVDLLGVRSEALQRAETASQKLGSARETLELVMARHEMGVVSSAELRSIQRDVLFFESDEELARIEVALIDEQLGAQKAAQVPDADG